MSRCDASPASGSATRSRTQLCVTPCPGGEENGLLPGYTTAEDWGSRLVSVPFAPLFTALGYRLFLGLWSGRKGLLDEPDRHRKTLRVTAIGGVTISILGGLPAALLAVGVWQPESSVAGIVNAIQVLTGVCGGAGYAAIFGLLGDRAGAPYGSIVTAISAVGSRSLTFYIANSVLIAMVLHYQLGGLGSHVGAVGTLGVAAGVWVVTTIVAWWMARTGRPGLLDALMRRLVNRGTT